jgi:hypothetical protein
MVMEEEIELVNIKVGLVKTDPELIKKLFRRLKEESQDRKNPYTKESQVKTLMLYNMWTIDQFCDVSGLKVSSVNNLARPTFSFKEDELKSKLNYCFPYRDSGGNGPKFIVRNEKSEKYIRI